MQASDEKIKQLIEEEESNDIKNKNKRRMIIQYSLTLNKKN